MTAALLFILTVPAAELPGPVQHLADTARTAPPELAADILIRLAESPAVRERAAKRALLEEAFESARGARHPLSLTGLPADPLVQALDLGLSRAALQSRIVRRMLPIDAATALKLFESMDPPSPGPQRCGETRAPRSAEYYLAFKELLRRGFTDADRRREMDFSHVSERVRAMRSPLDLEPMAEIIRDGNWTLVQLQDLATGYGLTLGAMQSDAATFQRAVGNRLQQRILELARRFVKNQIPPVPLIAAWRQFLLRHAAGPRCAAGVVDQLGRAFNESLLELGGARSLLPQIRPEDLIPAATEAPAPPPTPGEFHQTCARLGADPAKLIAFLKTSPVRETSPPEWYFYARRVLNLPEAAEDPLLTAYAELERISPTRP